MIKYETRLPTPEEFISLRKETDWGVPTIEQARQALSHSPYGMVVLDEDHLVGMMRCVGDGCIILYIQDVIVAENYRGQGIGQTLISTLITELETHCDPDCRIGLFAATGQEGFYKRLGFRARGCSTYGAGMHAKFDALRHHRLAISSAST